MPGPSWFAVLKVLQNADYVLTHSGTAPLGPASLNTGRLGYTDQAWCSAGQRGCGAGQGQQIQRLGQQAAPAPRRREHVTQGAPGRGVWHGRARCLGHLGNEPILRATRVPALQRFVYIFHEGILNRILRVQLDKFIQTLRDLKQGRIN
ncbi:hypothetical protein BC826DRAFT_1027318 [Russula brevipes]|nr:hypothetical protein BC826DRAFT_1027318 [Russula brevipes]